MKRVFLIVLAAALVCCLFGCRNQDPEMVNPVTVYYCREKVDYSADMGIIVADQLDLNGLDGRMLAFLNFYISTPVEEGFVSPFPAGASINAIEYHGESLEIQLNLLFSRLSAIELTVACACISLTLFELTNAYSVTFIYNGVTNETIAVMTRDNLVFQDLTSTA